MTIAAEDLRAAVARGIVTEGQAAQLIALLHGRLFALSMVQQRYQRTQRPGQLQG